jgi:hypothetical protein
MSYNKDSDQTILFLSSLKFTFEVFYVHNWEYINDINKRILRAMSCYPNNLSIVGVLCVGSALGDIDKQHCGSCDNLMYWNTYHWMVMMSHTSFKCPKIESLRKGLNAAICEQW